jgi:AraC family transcriptional regulator
MRVLVHVQARLEGDVSLAALARVAQLSPFHFAREFRRATGESPKQYTQRLRLERAAVRLWLHRGPILDVALDCGFRDHATFTRSFRRRFSASPREFRARGWARPARTRASLAARTQAGARFSLSETRVRELGELSLAFIRQHGPYENASEEPWDALFAWAIAHRVPTPHVWLGIGHDVPGVTGPERLRFDAALVVPQAFTPRGRVGHQRLPAARYAVTTHVGAYDTLPEVYGEIFARVARLSGWRSLAVPCVEIYHTTRVNPRLALQHTDVYVPVARVRQRESKGV